MGGEPLESRRRERAEERDRLEYSELSLRYDDGGIDRAQPWEGEDRQDWQDAAGNDEGSPEPELVDEQ